MLSDFLSAFSATADTLPPIWKFILIVAVSVVFGVAVALTYMKTNRYKTPSQSFVLTLVILPAVVTIIIMLVGSNMARAFSLAGAFAIIRFRSAPGDPKDITYVLFCMAIGLACGMGFLLYALAISLILCLVAVVLYFSNFGKTKKINKILKIQIPENLNYSGAFDEILKKYTNAYSLRRVRTTDLGSFYELNYSISMPDSADEKAFIDELRCRNGNLSITLVLEPQSDEIF